MYRAAYGLPPCTTANGCFKKVSQYGTTTYPPSNKGWAQEIALDLDMVSAICPQCKIVLVEAKTPSTSSNLGIAVNQLRAWGSTPSATATAAASTAASPARRPYYNHPGIAMTASSGDSGYGVEFPASSRHVIGRGRHALTRVTLGAASETAWSGAGSGCSAVITKPSWQNDAGAESRRRRRVGGR